MSNHTKLDEILEAYRKDCQRTITNEQVHIEGGLHLSKDQAKQAILDWADNQIKLAYREGYEAGREKIIKQQMEVKFQGLKRAGLKGDIDE